LERGVLLCEHRRDLIPTDFKLPGNAAVGPDRTAAFPLSELISFLPRSEVQCFPGGDLTVSIQVIVAAMLERKLAARGVQSLGHSDCTEIVENLLGRLKELDQGLVGRNIEPR
jgi:hypothetical protein